MSKGEAVYAAVRSKLQADGMPVDRPDYVMGDPPYRYDDVTIDNFLNVVKAKLAQNQPPYSFNYDAAFRTAALKLSVTGLIAKIQTRAKDAP